ncbi:uncharacterized protein LOC122922401 [Bufo gargarizans]|uniref:uncharacterized protein LOC122922401 n=1 Tax=Bufo gargarizans TaxID=30331 RepID=UPI001CF26009|nr:uncharacterized protein LOC122922401 [Bufo gargarizans]
MSTFAYTEDEARDIVSQVTASTDFLQIPSSELKSRNLMKESKHLIALELHAATLAEYHRTQRIPRGLRVKLRPTFFGNNLEYCTRFSNILNKCSLDLIVLTVEYLNTAIEECKAHITTAKEQLRDCLKSEDLATLYEKTDKQCRELQAKIEATKRSKFLRDVEDYSSQRVYRWQDKSGTAIPFFTRDRRTGSATSSTGSDTSGATSIHFLGKRRGKRRAIPGEPAAIIGEADAPRLTRSQRT